MNKALEREKQKADQEAFDSLFYKSKPKEPDMTSKLTELQQQIAQLQKERDELFHAEKAKAIEDVRTLVKTFSLNLKEIMAEPKKTRAKAEVKYQQGDNTWTGRGRKPKWVEDFIASGASLDSIKVN